MFTFLSSASSLTLRAAYYFSIILILLFILTSTAFSPYLDIMHAGYVYIFRMVFEYVTVSNSQLMIQYLLLLFTYQTYIAFTYKLIKN